MAWQLTSEVWNHAPADLTPGERLVLLAIAESVHQRDVRQRRCIIERTELARLTGMKPSSVTSALTRLRKDRGLDVRVAMRETGGRRGTPLYAVPGKAQTFRVPQLPAPLGCECKACRKPVDNSPEGSAVTEPSGSEASVTADPGSVTADPGSVTAEPGSVTTEPFRVTGVTEWPGPPRPPDHCAQHDTNPDDEDCGGCGDARRATEAWDVEYGAKYAAWLTEQRQTRLKVIAHCPGCQGSGNREDLDGRPVGKCDHREVLSHG